MPRPKRTEPIRLTVVLDGDASASTLRAAVATINAIHFVTKVSKQRRRYRDSKNGKVVTAAFAKQHPERTQLEWA